MLANYAFIGIFTVAAITFPLLPLILSRFLRPRRPTPIKQSTYECGLEVIGDLGSTNRNYVNGTQVTTDQVLHDGDTVSFGGLEMHFYQR